MYVTLRIYIVRALRDGTEPAAESWLLAAERRPRSLSSLRLEGFLSSKANVSNVAELRIREYSFARGSSGDIPYRTDRYGR